jgi:hypothetical protein
MPFTVRINVTGADSISKDLARLGAGGIALAKKVLAEKTQAMAAMARENAPIEDGDLRDRIEATKPVAESDGTVRASVRAASSVIQHEDLTLAHLHGGPKFIERAVTTIGPEIPEALAAELRRLR